MIVLSVSVFLHRAHILSILILVLGPVLLRVACEAIVIIFRINENLEEIKKNMQMPSC
jgi:hypothetical protein